MKILKRTIAVMMTVLMLMSTVSVGITSTAAKRKVKKIKLNKTSVTMYVGDTYKLKATVSPSNATNKKLTWTSSNKKVATVSSSGKITAKKSGKTTITVKAKDGSGKKATCKVTVKNVAVKSVKLNKSKVSVTEGKTYTLKATISPSKATDKTVTWKSSNKKIATVSSKGKVTAKKAGKVKITATAKNGKKATCTVTVKAAIAVKSIKLNKTGLSLTKGKTYTLKATVSPSNATNKSVTWSSSNTKVATVTSSGKITAVGNGTATITVKAKDGSGKKATCKITVTTPVTKVSLSSTSVSGAPGKIVALKATVSPSSASNKKITWSSSNTNVATVTSSGVVTLKKNGTAKITAKAADGSGKYATCNVTVATKVTQIVLPDTVSHKAGEEFEIPVQVLPTDAVNKDLVWSSSNEEVVIVDEEGRATFVGFGEAVITAKTTDGTVKATCKAENIAITKIEISKSAYSCAPNDGFFIETKIYPENATNKTLEWDWADKDLILVDDGNVITFNTRGTTIVTCKATDGSGAGAYCTVTVEIPLVEQITLSNTEWTGVSGETLDLTATVLPVNAGNKTLKWTTTNEARATVDDNGRVTLGSELGDVYITAESTDRTDGTSVKAVCKITVVDSIPATSVTLSKSSASGSKGGSVRLTATVGPDRATNKTVAWSSGNTAVATVDKEGNVSFVGGGTTVITATTTDGTNLSAECTVTVTEKAQSIDVYSTTGSWYKGKSAQVYAFVYPEGASQEVTWTSSNTDYATINSEGIVTIKKAPGILDKDNGLLEPSAKKITLTAKTKDGTNLSKSCEIIITGKKAVSSVSFSNDTYTMYIGQETHPEATVSPSDASETDVVYSSGDTSIVDVINNKLVAVGQGRVTITATSADDSTKKATAVINVITPSLSVMVKSEKQDYYSVGDELQLGVVCIPETVIADLGLRVVIEDESVVKFVSKEYVSGNVQPINFRLTGPGKTTITFETNNGKITSLPFEISVRDIVVDDYFEGVKVGETISIEPELMTSVVLLSDPMTCTVPQEYADCFEITETGKNQFDIKVLKEFSKGAYVTVSADEDKPEFFKNIYFSMETYEAVENSKAALLEAAKEYTRVASSATAKRDKVIWYSDINPTKATMDVSGSNFLTNSLIKAGMAGMSDEELGAYDMVYDVFAEPEFYQGETLSFPGGITVDESYIRSAELIDNGAVTYKIILNLGNQAKLGLSEINSSAYGKAMPVIDQAAVTAYENKLRTSLDAGTESFQLKNLSSGTIEQSYRNGCIVLTVSKLTDKIVNCEYSFISDVTATDANMKIGLAMESMGTIYMDNTVTFNMTIEETINYYDIEY